MAKTKALGGVPTGSIKPQEAAMVLGEAVDYARQGELAALRFAAPKPVPLAGVTPAP